MKNHKLHDENTFTKELKERVKIAITSQIIHNSIETEKKEKLELLETQHEINNQKIAQLKELFENTEAQADPESLKELLKNLI